jgi:triosephosphate isomerase (TIM)
MKSIVANWKMNFSSSEVTDYLIDFLKEQPPFDQVDLVIAPPFPYLALLKKLINDYPVALSAQDVHWENKGAYTGEVSASMLKDLGCSHAIVGHSERRHYFAETDERVYQKATASINQGLIPIVCIGEDRTTYLEGRAEKFILDQIQSLKKLSPLWIAYEPIWAIGTGEFPKKEYLMSIVDLLKMELPDCCILYGGSVNSQNLSEIYSVDGLQGYLVGGLSLKPKEFCAFLRHVSTQ